MTSRFPITKEALLRQGRVRYEEVGEGPTVLFLHGLLVSHRVWRGVIPALSAECRCIAPDLPLGSHELPLAAWTDLSPPGLADLVAEFLDALQLREVIVVANDTGGAIAQILVARHPDRVAGLVLTSCDAFNNFLPPLFRYLQVLGWVPGAGFLIAQALRAAFVRRLPIAFGWLTREPIDATTIESYIRPLRSSRGVRRDLQKVLRAISRRHTEAAAERLSGFRRPVLIIWAQGDRIFPVDHARRLAQLFPDARLVLVDRSRSLLPEDRPDRLAAEVLAFVHERFEGS
jgi:pimeloyl-ACP methyl ester carboxylesterase